MMATDMSQEETLSRGRLAGQVALVTGAGSGFGAEIARVFAREGAKVVVNDLRSDAADTVTAEINTSYGQGTSRSHACDVSTAAGAESMVKATLNAFGRLDIMVNNAGYTHRNKSMMDVGEEEYDRIFAVNVKAVYLSTQAIVPIMKEQGGGCIITTASTAGLRPRPGLTWYNASKGAAITMTKSMAAELAPLGIRVNCICPVAGETAMLADFMGGDTPETRAKFVGSIPLGRLSTPRDIADATLYLASSEAKFITGVALEVDGGRCI
ncbi:MAG: glucose 1-dehydrogenase [Pseudomonadota bacterium]